MFFDDVVHYPLMQIELAHGVISGKRASTSLLLLTFHYYTLGTCCLAKTKQTFQKNKTDSRSRQNPSVMML